LAENFPGKIVKARLQALRFLQGRPIGSAIHIIAKRVWCLQVIRFSGTMRAALQGANFLWINHTRDTRCTSAERLKNS